jgi:hypothetical protein
MSAMTYQHHVFISFYRHEDWTPWARELFRGLLATYLSDDFPDVDIYVDKQIQEGADWPIELGRALARSRVMVPIFSGAYFESQWCLHELDLMVGRSKGKPDRKLIVPVIVHDGERIPDAVDRKQAAQFDKFRLAGLRKDNPLYQEFSAAVKDLAPSVIAAIDSAPEFDEAWLDEAEQRCNEVYEKGKLKERVAVKYFEPKPRVALNKVPRI